MSPKPLRDTLEQPKLAAAAIRDLIRDVERLKTRMQELERVTAEAIVSLAQHWDRPI